LYKFGVLENNEKLEFRYPNIWCIEEYSSFSRGAAAPSKNQIELMLQLVKNYPPPYWVLYILVIPRVGQRPGRYQCPEPLSFEELEEFCLRYKDYFETDGRHHFWIASAQTNQMLVYDRHNVIYIYDAIDNIKDFFLKSNLDEKAFKFPKPHIHLYNRENDEFEVDIMKYFEWIYTELEDRDDI
jgi:hypothetical protein